MGSKVHSIVFLPEHGWTTSSAKEWLRTHNYHPIKRVDKVKKDGVVSQLRYRIVDPNMFRTFSTKKEDNGINIVIGWY